MAERSLFARFRASAGDAALDPADMPRVQGEALSLAARLPDLQVEAMRIASTVAHGIHGRRRAGPGETFWQFRQYQSLDDAAQIDWRRSASSDHLYIRQREWEAAHTFWLWADLSPSMDFASHLSQTTKRDRALVLTLAAADLLVRAGERVALIGRTRPTASRNAASRLAEAFVTQAGEHTDASGLPPEVTLPRFSGALLISDFLDPPDAITARLRALAANGVAGHLVQVLDPAEETLPYDGRLEFRGLEGAERWIADRAETLREAYQARLAAQRAAVSDTAGRLGWSFTVHHTDRSAAEPLLSLIVRLQASSRAMLLAQPGAGGRP